MSTLDTGINNVKYVQRYTFGNGSITSLDGIIGQQKKSTDDGVVYFVDIYFKDKADMLGLLPIRGDDQLIFIPTDNEPSTEYIDSIVVELNKKWIDKPCAIVGFGGGVTLDTAKAVSNLLGNGGLAGDYQGWDLLKKPGIFKIGIPTLSGTGSEATRTCVMTNKSSGLKLGMNSDFTVFDQIIMDPNLTKTVPLDQFFWTGMDAYIHCVEALSGSYRNAIGDAFSRETINLCRAVFNSADIKSAENREKMMVASYLGGCSIATSYVGVVHPFSAGLSVVLGVHHCVANCIVMRGMEDFYPEAYKEFWSFVETQEVNIPEGLCRNLSEEQYDALYAATVIHEKPLTNALGNGFKEILTRDKVKEIFKKI